MSGLPSTDTIAAMSSEVELYWCQRGAPVNKAVFFLLRMSILGTVLANILTSSCEAAYTSNTAFWFIGTLVITAVTAIRVYVINEGKWTWTAVTLILNSFNIGWNGYTTYATSYQLVMSGDSWACEISEAMPAELNTIHGLTRLHVSWPRFQGSLLSLICGMLADMVLIIVTWVCTFHHVRAQRRTRLWSRSIAWLLFRDGRYYLPLLIGIAMFSLNLVVCVIGAWSNNLTWISNFILPLQLVLMTRLLINLREASRSGGNLIIGPQSTPAESWDRSDPAIEYSALRFRDGRSLRDDEETRDNQMETGGSGNDTDDDTP
ncbi:uncharacterized protein B0H18DRAFT_1019385 [Fomitopsis serialis]|uniref:uncharacterized protein n=1 Tax=Fomitopsis serialis TaxID=139415 RepID=UPI002007C1F2|nr:uncharacterized protein B0H18DRAFT_1019385 [Neoantrodia serialis]KAH9921849.1 hypothetical protein B0H18DRAFT_1019385 [Neoantrodia serialis]